MLNPIVYVHDESHVDELPSSDELVSRNVAMQKYIRRKVPIFIVACVHRP